MSRRGQSVWALVLGAPLFGSACMKPIVASLPSDGALTFLVGGYDAVGGIELSGVNVVSDGKGVSLTGSPVFVVTYPWAPARLGLEIGLIDLQRPPCAPGTRRLPKPSEFLVIDPTSGEILERTPELPSELETACMIAPNVPTCFDQRAHGEPCYWRPEASGEPVWCAYDCTEPTPPMPPSAPARPDPPTAPDLGCASLDECAPTPALCPPLPGNFLGELRCRLQQANCANRFPTELPPGPTIFVDPAALPGGDGTRTSPYRQIDEAMPMAPGDVLASAEGTHFKDGILALPIGSKVIGACLGGARISTTSTAGFLWIDGDDVEMSNLSFDAAVVVYRGSLSLREARIDAGARDVALWLERGEARVQDVGFYDARVALRLGAGTRLGATGVVIGGRAMPQLEVAQVFGGSLTIDGLLGDAELSAGLLIESGTLEASQVLLPDVLRGAFSMTASSNATIADSEVHSRLGDAITASESRLALNRVRIAVETAPGLSFRSTRSIVRGSDWSLIGPEQGLLADQSDLQLARLDRSGPRTAISLHGPGVAALSDLRIHGTETCPIGVRGIYAADQALSLARAHISNSSALQIEPGRRAGTSTLTATDVTLEGDPNCEAMDGMDLGRQSGIVAWGRVKGSLSRAVVTGFDLDGIKLSEDRSDFTISDFVIRGLRTAFRNDGHAMSIGGRGSVFMVHRGVIEGAYNSALLLRDDGPTQITDLVVDAGPDDDGARGILVENDRVLSLSAFRVIGGDYGVVVSADAGSRVGRIDFDNGEIRQTKTAIQSIVFGLDPESLERVVLRDNTCDIISTEGGSRGCGDR